MEDLILKLGKNKPNVEFNAQTGNFKINGRGLIVDYNEFLFPIEKWLKSFLKNPSESITLTINLDYFNTVALKSLIKIISLIFSNLDKSKITINWYYYDIDTLEVLTDLEDTLNIKFNKIEGII